MEFFFCGLVFKNWGIFPSCVNSAQLTESVPLSECVARAFLSGKVPI